MPWLRVFICDRCSKRQEGKFLGQGWSEIDINLGSDDDDTEPPDDEGYVLCDDCTPVALDSLRSWVGRRGSRSN